MHALLLLMALAGDWPEVNTRVASGAVTIEGQTSMAIHTHGGEPAKLDSASFQVTVKEGASQLTVDRVEFLVGDPCRDVPWSVRSTPKVGGVSVAGAKATTALSLKPGAHTIVVGFEPVEAYQASCDAFAFRVHFDVGGETLVAVAEAAVSREEPLRDDGL